jgi:predicted nucleic acid-binding protein
MKALFDTNIVIDALSGHPKAVDEIRACIDPAVSVVTYLEVMIGTNSRTIDAARALLLRFKIVDVDVDIADYASALVQERHLNLTDAIIVATAQATGRTLITRDKKLANETDDPHVILPYELDPET